MRALKIQKYVLIGFMVVVAVGFGAAILYLFQVGTRALSGTITIPKSNLTSESISQEKQGSVVFSLSSDQLNDKLIYASRQADGAGVVELLDRAIELEGKLVLPKESVRNFRTIRVVDDEQDPFLKEIQKQANRKHFIFEQTIDGKPVYGARLSVHMKNDKQVYGMYGAVVNHTDASPAKLTRDQVLARAIAYAQEEYKKTPLFIQSSEEIIFNPQLLGAADTTNYPAISAIVTDRVSETGFTIFGRRIIISLVDGEVLRDENLLLDALHREIGDGSRCTVNGDEIFCEDRNEASGTYGNPEIDNAFQYAGDTYNYYYTIQQRDSYDNLGSKMTAIVNLGPGNLFSYPCPNNAGWFGGDRQRYVLTCQGMAANDVIAHEFTHGVIQTTAGLIYQYQSGALNEGYADVFATAVDPDWQMGEDTTLGVLRNFDDPTRNSPIPGPDRLFSPYYSCGSADNGGLHTNSSVINHAFYLMTQGGPFNGCAIRGIGRERALAIMYQALTRYLGPTADFRAAYSAILQACGDLYGVSSDDCLQVKNSLQSVEIDQQPLGNQQGAKCVGIAPQTPQCASASPPTITQSPTTTAPTVTRTPTPTTRIATPTITPTPTVRITITPTPIISHNNACLVGDTNSDGYVDLRDFEFWRRAPR